MFQGIKRAKGPPRKARLPITIPILRQLHSLWSPKAHDPDLVMLWAAVCLGFFAFLRSGEFTLLNDSAYDPESSLSAGDISIDDHANPSVLRIWLRQSKTDPFRAGVAVFVGRTGDTLCPVAATLAYLGVLQPGPCPLFRFQDGKPLTRHRLVCQLRQALQQIGLNYEAYSGHRFRIGAATAAAQVGLSVSTIQMHGRWQSAAFQRYIHTPKESLALLSKRLVAQNDN